MAWTPDDIPDLTGRIAVVTGGNGGLGLVCVHELAKAGAHVVLAARDQDKARVADEQVRARNPAALTEIVPLDLGSLASVASTAETIQRSHPRIDLLVNNAGVMAMPKRTTDDGFEMQFGVDHLGHFALTAHLLPALLRADAARVVTVTSTVRFAGSPVDPADPHYTRGYGPWRAYARAKWANYHFGLGLQRQFEKAGLRATSNIAHPGLSNTDLQSRTVREGGAGWLGAASEVLAKRSGMPAALGARPQLRAATDPASRGGELYAPRYASNGPAVRRPILRRWDLDRRIADLWALSQRETDVLLDVTRA
ncbi:short-chain dehydrogenase [Blastococcus sp. TBT05-19]|uniref:SDR family NAD(P)-dependent oxidoreductase n=1 Tax=Blastococcus sp. TBT05-19 TaxID=2250581 RepID=UPI000DEBFBAF|nr:SDR family NAD(P)-dependent oxidoreductase [Blastococcus sp. TBT05-19]RBY92361.1 short-chain dehydrogenase [Blastococcus sp. TBT05-19]